jgi:hypothetical protein
VPLRLSGKRTGKAPVPEALRQHQSGRRTSPNSCCAGVAYSTVVHPTTDTRSLIEFGSSLRGRGGVPWIMTDTR